MLLKRSFECVIASIGICRVCSIMKRPAAALASASKRTVLSAQESAPNRSQRDASLAKGDVSELRQQLAKVGEELRAAEAEQAAQRAKLKQAEKDAKNAREALASLQGVVAEKRSALAEITQQVSVAVRAAGATKVSLALGQAIFYTTTAHYEEDDAGGGLECEVDVAVQAECYRVVQSGKSAKVIRYECGSKASETKADVPQALEQPKKPLTAYFIWLADNRNTLIQEAGTSNMATISRLASEKWKGLGEATRDTYQQRALEANTAYEKAMEEFVSAGGMKSSSRAGKKERKSSPLSDFIISCAHICGPGNLSGTVVCTTMAGGEVGRFAVPPGEDALGMWLPGDVLQSVSVPKKCRLRLVNAEGDVFWTQADDAARPLVNNMRQLNALKKQHQKEGCVVAATKQAAIKAVQQGLNFGDDACLGRVLMGSYEYKNLSSLMPSKDFLTRDYGDYESILALKQKLANGLGLDKFVSDFLTRQCQRGCQTIMASYIGDKTTFKSLNFLGKSQRKMLITGCSPAEGTSSNSTSMLEQQLEEVLVIDVEFEFHGHDL